MENNNEAAWTYRKNEQDRLPSIEHGKKTHHRNKIHRTEKIQAHALFEAQSYNGWTTKRRSIKRISLSLHGITIGHHRLKLEELVSDRERWKDTTAPWLGRLKRGLLDLT